MRVIPVFLAVAVISGCVTNPIAYHNPNVTQRQMNADYDACRVQGLQDVPSDRVTTAQYDTNFNLRQNIIEQCMRSKGYVEVSLPACGPNVSAPNLDQRVNVGSGTCVYGGGRYYAFVNR